MLSTADVLQAMTWQSWFTTIDLKDDFHVPITPHHRLYVRFAFEGPDASHGNANNWLICAPAWEQAGQDTALLCHVTWLGLAVNHAKSCLISSQRIVFIGITLD